MPQTDQQRIAVQRQSTRVLLLWRALQPLQSVLSFMNTGAHPDDETTSMLAALGLRDGLSLSFACANRGEGGQNNIGVETTQDLGVLRTAEMERAADVLDMRLYWLSQNSEDTIFDFGFSKSGDETLNNWGHRRTLKRFVDIVRQEKPDIVCPTFLDIPGQHGHHRAMTQLAHEVFDVAADASYSESAFDPWQIKKLYLPAWSGAGDAYDDDLPPPPATLIIDANGVEGPSGWSWAQIAQHSRACHLTQGMGSWIEIGRSNTWPLHLERSVVDVPDTTLASGIPATIGDLAQLLSGTDCARVLELAQSCCNAAITAWPEYDEVAFEACKALQAIREAQRSCPETLRTEMQHRLRLKEEQLSRVIRIATGVNVIARVAQDFIEPGQSVQVTVEANSESADVQTELVVPDNWQLNGTAMFVPHDEVPSDAYRDFYDPINPTLPALKVLINQGGIQSSSWVPLENPPVVTSARRAVLAPEHALLNLASSKKTFNVSISDIYPRDSDAELKLPAGWLSATSGNTITVTPPGYDKLQAGLIELPLYLNGNLAQSTRTINYPHVSPRARVYPASVSLRVLDIQLPDVKIGYIGGGHDRVGYWLSALGMNVVDLTDDMLDESTLRQFDTIVAGIFVMRTRPELLQAMPTIHNWIRCGGNLVTLYHRPWDAWDPQLVPPKPMTIGKPSLRWRVTDENAEVTHLQPEHVLLNSPNVIDPEVWENWHKERGLYFASEWDEAYDALLSMHDPQEEPHHGALLSAKIGKGRHTHTSLILHHQMEKLVPGAFKLMANLVAS